MVHLLFLYDTLDMLISPAAFVTLELCSIEETTLHRKMRGRVAKSSKNGLCGGITKFIVRKLITVVNHHCRRTTKTVSGA